MRKGHVVQFAVLIVGFGTLGTAGAQSSTGESVAPSAPWTPYVPDGYEPAPGGKLLHKSCVHTVPTGAQIDVDGNANVDGVDLPRHPPCAYPSIKSSSLGPVPGMHDTFFTWQAPGPPAWTAVSSNQYVPSNPQDNDGQVIFYWNGLEEFAGGTFVLQPVLQWGSTGGFGGQYWQIASWVVFSDGSATRTPGVQVGVGDYLDYDVEAVSTSGLYVTYNIRATDVTTGSQAFLSWWLPQSTAMNDLRVIPAALEFYYAPNCQNDVPEAEFTNLHQWTGTLVPLRYTLVANNPQETVDFNQSLTCPWWICSGFGNCSSPNQTQIFW